MAKMISRKDFLKGTAAGALSIAAAGLLGSGTVVFADEEKGKYIPGTYTATAQGLESEVTVTMTFDETSITDVVIDVSGETKDIGAAIGDTMKEAILSAQSADVDAVSGASITSNAVKAAANDCIAQAQGAAPAAPGGEEAAEPAEEDWLGTAPEISDADVEEEIETEVLVIGCGVAGVAAVRSAAERGAKVVACDKASGPQCRSGEYAVINGKTQARWGRDTFTNEDIEQMINFHMMESSYKCKRAIMSKWAYHSGENFDWWIEPNKDLFIAEESRSDIPDESATNCLVPLFLPLPEPYDWRKEEFPCYPTSVEFLPDQTNNLLINMEYAVSTGNVEERYGCFAEKLVMEDGRCTGAYLRNAETGKYILVKASKGVILATGDYSQNDAMVQHFCPDVIDNGIMRLFTSVDVEGKMTNTGDGIKLGMWAGAAVQHDHAPMIHHMGGGADSAGVGVMGISGYLNLDMNGKRFMNEDLPGQQVENQIELQKGRTTWQIFDSNWPEQLPYFPAAHGVACYFEDYASPEEGPKNNQTNRNYKSWYQLEAAVEDGRAIKADTLEELVAQMYPDDEQAQKTALASIERYNELAKKGVDEDFGKVATRMWPLENGPFYADQFVCALLLVICGGLESDEDCHTFDADRNIIPGLYVAGNVQGSRFAHEYPITLKGVSHAMAVYYGYVAGQNVVDGI